MKTGIAKKSLLVRGFTLVEIMLVVAIIGILSALVIPVIASQSEHARAIRAQADIKGGLKSALNAYNTDMGTYPQSLEDLVTAPRNKAWRGPYFDPPQIPVDPWGNAYQYSYPGKHNPTGYDLWSNGPRGKAGDKDNIGNWQP